jgi:phosphomannomutase
MDLTSRLCYTKGMDATLRDTLDHEPRPLRFGTSGRRGLLADLTQLEVYICALGELRYLQALSPAAGGVPRGGRFYFAHDLRPSSVAVVNSPAARGGLAQAIQQAIIDAGMEPVNLGPLPTPALMSYACERRCGSMMVTGSHIPFDRNGYKTNSARGELLKKDEAPVGEQVDRVRQELYAQGAARSPFDGRGLLKRPPQLLPPLAEARQAYLDRYLRFFSGGALRGLRLLVYQHSAVGRDLLVEVLQQLGAEVFAAGRSDTFVPIDTEAIDAAQLEVIEQLAHEAWRAGGPFDAVVSTDGDSDRPLLVGLERSGAGQLSARFFGGDLVGMVVAEYLGADAVVVPISCNDAIDRGALKPLLEPKTRIGSPYVIAGMEQAAARGRQRVCGWEANGGFLTGSDIERAGRLLPALPTRDAFLPIIAPLASARERGLTLTQRFEQLPRRFSRAGLLRNFPRSAALHIVESLSVDGVANIGFAPDGPSATDAAGQPVTGLDERLLVVKRRLGEAFTAADGFAEVAGVNYTDGVRVYFSTGEVAHVRPSGNADELRIYAVADTQARADAIAAAGVAEPAGILRQLERRFGVRCG